MEYRSLGRTGAKVAPLALGTDNFMDPTPEEDCERILLTALDAGINLVDTGDVYADGEGERVLGRILKRSGRRHEVLIGTKCDHGRRQVGATLEDYTEQIGPNEYGHSRLNIIRACEASLTRLDTDYIDLYQMHRPSPDIPFEETLGALHDLVTQGKIRYIGCSTHPAWMVMESIGVSKARGWARYVSEQPPYNLLDRRIENELIPMCQRHGVGLITWAPMAMGCIGRSIQESRRLPGRVSRCPARRLLRRSRNASWRGGRHRVHQDRRIRGTQRCPAGDSLVQGSAGDHRAADRAANDAAPRAAAAGAGDGSERRGAPSCDDLVPPGSVVADFHNTADWMKTVVGV